MRIRRFSDARAFDDRVGPTLMRQELENNVPLGIVRSLVAKANEDALQIRAEATVARSAAEHRLEEIERLEADFDELVGRIAERLGVRPPSGGWWRHILRRR